LENRVRFCSMSLGMSQCEYKLDATQYDGSFE